MMTMTPPVPLMRATEETRGPEPAARLRVETAVAPQAVEEATRAVPKLGEGSQAEEQLPAALQLPQAGTR